MITAITNRLGRLAGLTWLTGPIFDKELLVSSRRARYYTLRFVYLILLTICVAILWIEMVETSSPGSPAYQTSRMAEAGKHIITLIIWFQFIVAQFLAATMLSNSLSEEIKKQTLGLLMTTPITSLQIVMGKLLSKLLHIILLLAMSLPLLAVVRVFGGVIWDFLIAGLCITLTAVLLAGSISITFSLSTKKNRQITTRAVSILIFLYLGIPSLTAGILHFYNLPGQNFETFFTYTNPFFTLAALTDSMISGSPATTVSASWPLHCIIMLAGSVLLLTLTTILVRKVALRQINSSSTNQSINWFCWWKKSAPVHPDQQDFNGPIRRIKGSPIVWKEIKAPLNEKKIFWRRLTNFFFALIIITAYSICIWKNWMLETETQVAFVIAYLVIGMTTLISFGSSSITSEREARTWPLLLTTPLDNWQIIKGKALGILRRSLPLWLLLFGHVAVFTCIGAIHPSAIFLLIIPVASLVSITLSAGLFFSSWPRKTVTATNLTIGFFVLIGLIFPIFVGIGCHGEGIFSSNPIVQAGIIMGSSTGSHADRDLSQLSYDWPIRENQSLISTIFHLIIFLIINLAASYSFTALATINLRYNIFPAK